MRKYILSLFVVILAPLFANNVAPDGSYDLAVEFVVPPGTNGLQPKIGLQYSSSGGNGIVGVGWQLDGIQMISRIQNGQGVSYNGHDTYAGPAGKLVDISGNKSLFHSEMESFARYVPTYGTCGAPANEPCAWILTDAVGNTLEFGMTSDARVPAIGKNGAVRIWSLNKLSDIHGNFYTIQYAQDSGEIYPEKIIYTQSVHGGISRFRVVEFVYDTGRADYFQSFLSGSPVETKWRLQRVMIKTGVMTWGGFQVPFTGDLVRRYELSYSVGATTSRSTLTGIQEFGSDNISSLPAKNFTYRDGSNGLVANYNAAPIGYTSVQSGDCNGDGEADLMLTADNGYFSCYMSNGTVFSHQIAAQMPVGFAAIIGDYNGDGKSDFAAYSTNGLGYLLISTGTGFTVSSLMLLPGGYDALQAAADCNGDGKSDLMLAAKNGTHSCLVSNGSQFVAQWIGTSGADEHSLVGDFNGDGRSDFITYSGGRATFLISNGSGFTKSVQTGLPTYLLRLGAAGDCNGDGKSDFMVATQDNGFHCLISNGTLYSSMYSASIGIGYEPPVIGDFNGDGKMDFAAYAQNGNVITLISTGSSFYVDHTPYGPHLFTGRTTGDCNGDGLGDLMLARPDGHHVCYLSNGRIFSQQITVKIGEGYNTTTGGGPGRTEFLVYAFNGHSYSIKVPGRYPDLLESHTNGMGSTTTLSYAPSTNVPGAIVPAAHSYPFAINNTPQLLVTQVAVTDGKGASYATTYQYYNNLRYNGPVDVRRNLGFEWVRRIGPDNSATQTFFLQNDIHLAGSIAREITFDSNGQMISDSRNSYSKINPFAGTILSLVSQKTNVAYQSNLEVNRTVVDMTYDGYGFLIEKKTAISGFSPIVERLTVMHDIPNWLFGRTTDVEVFSGSTTGLKLKHERSVYNGSGLLCAQPNQKTLACEKHVWLDKTKNGPENRFIPVRYAYTPYGLIAATTNGLNRVLQYNYDSDYQSFIAEEINPLGQRLTRTHDVRNGGMLTETDHANGVTVSQQFDALGRLVKVFDANGHLVRENLFLNLGQPAAQYAETRITDDSADGYQWSRDYADGLGTYKKEGEGIGLSHSLRTDITFDSAGRKTAQSSSYLVPGGTPRITFFAYDSVGRLNMTTYPEDRRDNTGKVKSVIAYGVGNIGGKVTTTTQVTDAQGNIKIVHKDARGQKIRIIDANGATVTQSYDEMERLIQTVDADGKVSTIEYDSLARKIRMVEPNTGTTLYSYDDAGNIIEQIDGKGQTIRFHYDALGRITLRDLPGSEGDIIYEYDRSANTYGKRRLAKVTDAAGIVELNYDNRGNTISSKRTIDGYAFTFESQYDLQNRVKQLTYPDGYIARNYFSDAGHIRQVRMLAPGGAFGSALVTYQGPETTGMAEARRILGNGVVTKVGFDEGTTRPTYARTYLKNDPGYTNPIQDLTYSFDDVGNLSEITDEKNANRSESFYYDSLSRVRTATSPMYGTKNYVFSLGGNLTQKNGIQFYSGGSSNCASPGYQPAHAVCADSNGNQYAYDANGNMISPPVSG
jgi:YD repeat-containing protein